MPRVMIKCPSTGKDVPTPYLFDEASFKETTIEGDEFGPCPACGGRHKWGTEDAFLEGSSDKDADEE